MEKYKKEAIFCKLKNYCSFAKQREMENESGDFMEVTKWINSEGFDVVISTARQEKFCLTFGEFEALKELVKQIDN